MKLAIRKSRRLVFAIAAAALVLVLLVACGSSNAGGSNAGSSAGSGSGGSSGAAGSPAESGSPAAGSPSGSDAGGSDAAPIEVVAAENFYGAAAEAVGGKYVHVTSLLTSPDADPHDYEPTPDASRAVADAKLVVFNGIGYDDWMQKLIAASGDAADKTVVQVARDVMGHQAGDNEHVWYDPETMPKLADALAESLGKLAPAHRDDFVKNAEAYKASLAPLAQAVASLKQASPLPIAVSEPVFDYMAQALNLAITDDKFKLAAEEETDPAPADVAKLQDDIKGGKIKFFVNNTQASSTTVENLVDLARQSGVPVVEVTETMPAGKTYLQWMTDQLKQIEDALK